MRRPMCLTVLAALLFAGASLAAGPAPFGTLQSGIGLFAATDDQTGLELWRSDGTAAGTYRLTDDACNAYCEDYTYFFAPWIEAGDRAFVLAQEGDVSTLWVTDGSRAGTLPVYEGVRISTLSPPVWVQRLRLLFFVVQAGGFSSYDYELWRSDGTPAGTRKVKAFVSADSRGGVRELTEFRGRVFFNGQDPANGPSLWRSDGTEAGTVLVRRFVRDFERIGPWWLRAVGSRLLFHAPTPEAGEMLWASDGTRAGTRPIFDVQPGARNYPSVADARVVGDLLFFATSSQLWVSDGTRSGTRALTPAFGGPPHLSQESLFKGRYYFEVNTEDLGWEIWSTGGTRAGTRPLADLCPQHCSSVTPGGLRVAGNRLLFAATTSFQDVELWKSDGTARGTRRVKDIVPGEEGSNPGPVYEADGKSLFFTFTLAGHQLWRTDGTGPGTVPVSGIFPAQIVVGEIPGALLFRVWDETGRDELWRSDGTRAGTRRLKTFGAGD